jgi:hypothetical protein
MRVLAYRLQTDAFGSLDKSIQRMLASKKEQGAAVPFNRRAPQTQDGVRLKAGAMLVREWKGKLERVMILEDGFAWNGQTFGSLSQIARAMTGTNWNGHRFFGLRQAKTLVAMKQRPKSLRENERGKLRPAGWRGRRNWPTHSAASGKRVASLTASFSNFVVRIPVRTRSDRARAP